MKKFTILYIFLLLFALTKPANAESLLDKKVSIDLQNETIAAGLQQLQENYQVYFSYINKLEQINNKTTLKITRESLDVVLSVLFKDSNIDYYELYDQIVLIEKKLAKSYNLQVLEEMENNPDTVRIYNISYLEENSTTKTMSISDLWRALMMQKLLNEPDSGFTWVRYDTLSNPDTVKITIDSLRKKSTLKLQLKPSKKIWQHELTLAPDLMVTSWQMNVDNISTSDLKDINDYGTSEVSLSFGLLYGLRYKIMSLQTGLELNMIRRETRHTETLINRSNNNAEAIRTNRKAAQYTYLSVPLLAGINLGWENMYIRVSGGWQFNFLTTSSGATFYPKYEPIYYFTTLDLLYDAEDNLIEEEEIQLRPSFAALRLQIMGYLQMNKNFNLTAGFIYRSNNQSIYEDDAPLEETFSGFAFTAGIQYIF